MESQELKTKIKYRLKWPCWGSYSNFISNHLAKLQKGVGQEWGKKEGGNYIIANENHLPGSGNGEFSQKPSDSYF